MLGYADDLPEATRSSWTTKSADATRRREREEVVEAISSLLLTAGAGSIDLTASDRTGVGCVCAQVMAIVRTGAVSTVAVYIGVEGACLNESRLGNLFCSHGGAWFGALLAVSRQPRLGAAIIYCGRNCWCLLFFWKSRKNWYCAPSLRRGAWMSLECGACVEAAGRGRACVAWMVALGRRLRFSGAAGRARGVATLTRSCFCFLYSRVASALCRIELPPT